MFWLDKHTRYKKSKSNLDLYDEDNTLSLENVSDAEDEHDNAESIPVSCFNSDIDGNSTIIASPVSDQPKNKRKIKTNEVPRSQKLSRNAIADAELDVMKSMTKVLNKRLETPIENAIDHDDFFGKVIAGELKSFPEHIKFRVKHDINNVIFNYNIRSDKVVHRKE